MNEQYVKPEMEIEEFKIEDIMASGDPGGGQGGDDF